MVHFIQQPGGTFHPKLYLFTSKGNKWELIVGSANFTTEAFSRNTEACILLSNKDSNSTELYSDALELVEETFAKGKTYKKSDLERYRRVWKNQRQKLKSLSGQYGSKKTVQKPIHEVETVNRNWKEYMRHVETESCYVEIPRAHRFAQKPVRIASERTYNVLDFLRNVRPASSLSPHKKNTHTRYEAPVQQRIFEPIGDVPLDKIDS